MKFAAGNTLYRFAALLLFFAWAIIVLAYGGVPDKKVQLPKSKGTVYHLLRQLSEQSGYMLIYDSQIIDNDKVVKINKGEYTLREAIYKITGNDKLEIKVVGSHILLQLPDNKKEGQTTKPAPNKNDSTKNSYITLSGVVLDRITDDRLPYSAIGVDNTTIGVITNQDGEFRLTLPDSLRNSVIRLSHVGYQNPEIDISLLIGQHVRFALNPKVIPLQEIVVRAVDPVQVLDKMLANRKYNYSASPVYLTTFYREGIDHKKKGIDLTEAVLKVYKTGYNSHWSKDQVKLIKMRRIESRQASDTVFSKMKSGINSSLMLDIVKNLPDFLQKKTQYEFFAFTHTDISVVDGKRVNIISFEQNKGIEEPLYKGQLYIDAENYALVEARFEINPKYVKEATNMFIERKARSLNIELQRAYYTVSYKESGDSIYYINHIRGDLDFKVRQKRRLFSSPLHLWFEMVNCKVDTDSVNGFPRNERLATRNIFSETKHVYDKDFWGNFNIILPEERLKELIINNLGLITED